MQYEAVFAEQDLAGAGIRGCPDLWWRSVEMRRIALGTRTRQGVPARS